MSDLRVHALFVVVGDLDLFRASLASIYPFAQGITVSTTYDRDWYGRPYPPDRLVELLLTRELDPDRKVDVIVTRETNQARLFNRAMDAADPSDRSRRVLVQHPGDTPPPRGDYFWLVDADEIYERSVVPRLLEYVRRYRRPYYQVAAHHYFKTWNHRVDAMEYFTAFVRADKRVGNMRNPKPTLVSKVGYRILPNELAARLLRIYRVPPEIATFHHGSWIGPRERIAAKIRYSPHARDIQEHWLERVWDRWSPDAKDLHPTDPQVFPSTHAVATGELPPEIRDFDWPSGYLDE